MADSKYKKTSYEKKRSWKETRKCKQCGIKFEVTHQLRMYCENCKRNLNKYKSQI